MTLPAVLRGALLLLLVVAAFLLPTREADAPTRRVVRLPIDWYRPASPELFTGPRPRAVVRRSAAPPDADELAALAALDAPVLAALPEEPGSLELLPPARPIAGRAAALEYRARGEPGDSAWLVFSDDAGPIDSALVRFDAAGAGSGAIRVRPAREGWRRWSAALGGSVARTAAWTSPARPLRVLAFTGPPLWESKFAVRALEESGASVELREPLGRGLQVRSAGGTQGEEDVVLLLDGSSPGADTRNRLASWVSEQGGGVLLAGDAAGSAPLAPTRRAASAGEVSAGELRWRLPPELSPLPDAEVRSAFTALREPRAGVRVAATAPAGSALALRAAGRGRVAALGVTESWRWRMQAGQVAEHRAFWRSLTEWLAGGAREPVVIVPSSVEAAPGETMPVTVYARSALPTELTLRHPGGVERALLLTPDPGRPGVSYAEFIPSDSGVHTLGAGSQPLAAVEVRPGAATAAPWARLALLADRSGGGLVEQAGIGAEATRWEADDPDEPMDPRPWLFAAVLLLGAAEWGIRRIRGRA